MKRNILLPTDFSANASQAISYALELYKDEECQFYLLNVFSFDPKNIYSIIDMTSGSELYENVKADSESELAKLLNIITIKEHGNPKHDFHPISVFNSPLEGIKNVVEEKDIELIIMGAKGQTKAKANLYGSVSVSVMEKVRNCPVIVVPELAKPHLPKEIVFPTSYKTHFKKRELGYLIDISKRYNASIKILHVANEDELNEKQLNGKKLLDEYFKDVNHSFHSLSHMPEASAINCFVESRESDMVAFVNRKHKFFESILTRPLVKEISFSLKVPILVMHDLRN